MLTRKKYQDVPLVQRPMFMVVPVWFLKSLLLESDFRDRDAFFDDRFFLSGILLSLISDSSISINLMRLYSSLSSGIPNIWNPLIEIVNARSCRDKVVYALYV